MSKQQFTSQALSSQFATQNSDTRREMLTAIRAQLAASAPHDAARRQPETLHPSAVHVSSPAALIDEQSGSHSGTAAERFRAALDAVGGHCTIVADQATAATAIEQILDRTQARQVAVSGSSLVQSVIAQIHTDAHMLTNADTPVLFDCDVGITSAQWAIAETGTLVLESDQERHRLTSLVPTAHIALIYARQIRQTLGEVLEGINSPGAGSLSRTVTFITGPSRTSDIELTLAIGVHGPAELYAIVIEDPVA